MKGLFKFKDCSLYVRGILVEKGDELIALTGELSLGNVPSKIRKLGLTEEQLVQLETLLTQKIFIDGNCLTPDDKYLENGF